jgi:hypothetical protein
MEAQEEFRLVRGQKDYLELEIRKFRRKRLNQFHLFEQGLLREVCYFIYIYIYIYTWILLIFTEPLKINGFLFYIKD